MEKLATFLEKR